MRSDELYIFDAVQGRYRVPTGSYTIRVGGSSDRLPLSAPFTVTPATERSDLLVANIRSIPAFPSAGDRVLFVASVLNRGTGPTPSDKALSVEFRIAGQVGGLASPGGLRQSIPAGGMALVCGSEGPAGNACWRNAVAGTFAVQAEVDSRHVIEETIESNNINTSTRSVRPR